MRNVMRSRRASQKRVTQGKVGGEKSKGVVFVGGASGLTQQQRVEQLQQDDGAAEAVSDGTTHE